MKYWSWIFLLMITIFGACNKEENIDFKQADPTVNWNTAADSSSNALINKYWNTSGKYFNNDNGGNTQFGYWPQAHALDVLLDAYARTNDSYYLSYINQWYDGVKVKNGNTFLNHFYDDMEWNALAMLRAYSLTGDQKFKTSAIEVWNDIKTGWNTYAGGGLMWKKDSPKGKNACSNGPAAILAARLYQIDHKAEDLEWAKKIYDWEKSYLVDPTNGAVWDNISDENGTLTVNKNWVFTYNQGTFIGAALELYKITGEAVYMNDAIKSSDYALNSLTNSNDRILKSEGTGDGGLFKGVFVRYFTQLILQPGLSEGTQKRYIVFLEYNARTLWTEGTNKSLVLFGTYWKTRPGSVTDLPTQLSGAMLMESAALLKKQNLLAK